MNIKYKLKKLNLILDEIEKNDNLSKESRNILQKEFQTLLGFIHLQQKEISQVKLKNIQYEIGLRQSIQDIHNHKSLKDVEEVLLDSLNNDEDKK